VAYEFKLRVTIAASGQGRFGEELSFPRECSAAGITPLLVVLDPTPSIRLTELANAFLDHGGSVYIGDEAWQHLEDKAGSIMSRFIDYYIKEPLSVINAFDTSSLQPLKLSWDESGIIIQSGRQQMRIDRQQDTD